ncbi:MAG: accessory factor UbiK family protein [Candidatus Puniceispirillaceae bacterium]|jgi:BMFP domain-containing protein YqiC
MKPRSNLISDLAQMANGAASALGTMREDVQMMRRGRAERSQAAAGMVTQEDFEALMSRVDALSARIAYLESQLKQPAKAKRATTKKKQG